MAGKESKYRNTKIVVDNIMFDSIREAERYKELKLLERAKEVAELKLQPRFKLSCGGKPIKVRSKGFPGGRHLTYIADFQYWDCATHKTVVEDVKGFDTPVSRMKRAILEAETGILVDIVR